jgi:hypothetical protein
MLLLSPALVMFLLSNTGAIGRIEQIGTIITVINALLIRWSLRAQARAGYGEHDRFLTLWTCLIVFLPVSMLSVLMFAHEATLLLSLPINLVLTYIFLCNVGGRRTEFTSLAFVTLAYVPVGASFLYILLNKNDSLSHAYEICSNISDAYPQVIPGNCSELPYILKIHTLPLFDAIEESLGIYYRDFDIYLIFLAFGIFLTLVSVNIVVAVFRFEKKRLSADLHGTSEPSLRLAKFSAEECDAESERALAGVIFYFLIIPLLCSMPLYVIGMDWGRWTATINLQFVLVSMISLHSGAHRLIRLPYVNSINPSAVLKIDTVMSHSRMMLPVFIVVCFLFRLPHWANEPYRFVLPHLWQAIKHYF